MVSFTFITAAALSALLPATYAQTHTACNPLFEKGCPEMQALGGNGTFNFNETLYDKVFNKVNKGTVEWSSKGATMMVNRPLDSPQLQSKFYMLFGRLEVVMRTASGQGIISTAILQSEALDEIDWEFQGGNTTSAMTNYYGKGHNETAGRGENFVMEPSDQDFHNYTIDWTKERIQWWLDGRMVRELKYADAKGGAEYPQTPMNIRIGIWAAGDEDNNEPGVVKWAGGPTDFGKGPFTMVLRDVYAQDYTTAKAYSWDNMDESGSWEKVKIIEGGKSDVLKEIQSPSGVKNRWNALSKTAKIAIIAAVLGFVVLVALFVLFCCIRQRRRGRREFAARQAADDKEAAELLTYKGAAQSNVNLGYNRI